LLKYINHAKQFLMIRLSERETQTLDW